VPSLDRADLEALFQEQVPRFFNLDFLESAEFKKEGGVVLAVVEKEKAVQEVSELVGRLEIKNQRDLEKYKKKQQTGGGLFSTY
jgi:nucleoside diphosphate kinase